MSVYWNQLKHKQQVVVLGRTFNVMDEILMKMIKLQLIFSLTLIYFKRYTEKSQTYKNEIQNHMHYYAFTNYEITQVHDKLLVNQKSISLPYI